MDCENLTTTIAYVFDRDLRSRGPSFSKFLKNVVEVTDKFLDLGYYVSMFVCIVLWQTEKGVRLCF